MIYLSYYEELDEAYEEGYHNFLEGYSFSDCPFLDDDLAFEWEEGWLDARFDYKNRY